MTDHSRCSCTGHPQRGTGTGNVRARGTQRTPKGEGKSGVKREAWCGGQAEQGVECGFEDEDSGNRAE